MQRHPKNAPVGVRVRPVVVARSAGWLLGWSVDAVLWPPSWAKEGNGRKKGRGRREQIEPQAKRQTDPS